MRALSLSLLFIASTALAQNAAETILPGDPRVDGSFIHSVTNAWKMTATSPGGKRSDGGVWKDKIEVIDENGQKIIRRTQLDESPDGTTTFITETDQKSLTPIRAEVTTANGLHRVLTFGKDKVHSIVTAPPAKAGDPPRTRESDIAVTQPMFDFNGGLFGLLVASFPLQKDFTAKFPVFDPRSGLAWATYSVIDRERVPAGKGKTVEAWTVEVQDPVRNARMLFSITKDAPYIIRLQEIGEGKFWTFDMM